MEFKSLLNQFELSAFEGDRFQIDTFMPIIQVMHAEDVSFIQRQANHVYVDLLIESSRLNRLLSSQSGKCLTFLEMSDHNVKFN